MNSVYVFSYHTESPAGEGNCDILVEQGSGCSSAKTELLPAIWAFPIDAEAIAKSIQRFVRTQQVGWVGEAERNAPHASAPLTAAARCHHGAFPFVAHLTFRATILPPEQLTMAPSPNRAVKQRPIRPPRVREFGPRVGFGAEWR